jgi:diazepam-binding inhibitor (GABA receptor modulating acyl-CoA-binding protein)
MSDADAAFAAAVEYVKTGPKPATSVPNSEKLKVYALYKQATEGDVTGSQPWAVQLEKRAKWDAWAAVKGMSNEDAKKAYAAAIEQQKIDYPPAK